MPHAGNKLNRSGEQRERERGQIEAVMRLVRKGHISTNERFCCSRFSLTQMTNIKHRAFWGCFIFFGGVYIPVFTTDGGSGSGMTCKMHI